MRLRHTLLTLTLLSATALTLSSCHHKDLEYATPVADVVVVFDWRDAPDADPSSMGLYLYNTDDNSSLRYIFDNKNGGPLHAPLGQYSALCINSDNTDWARVTDTDDIDGFEILTHDVSMLTGQSLQTYALPRAAGTETERMVATPGMLWGSRLDNIDLIYHEGTTTVTLYPEELICRYTVTVLDVENLEYARGASIDATLSGMAQGYMLGLMRPSDTAVTMPFSLAAPKSGESLNASFLTFGVTPTRSLSHILTIYVILADGTKWYYTFDVTDQVNEAPDPRHVDIIVRGISLPTPISGGSGFIPDVNDWQAVDVDLDMHTGQDSDNDSK